MRIGTFASATGALALGLVAWMTPTYAQVPMYDRVDVNLPYTITLGNTTLQPGDYVIQELPTAGKSYVLMIYSDDGRKYETSAITIPTLDPGTPDDTKVVLHHFGNDYYFDKVWIQGKNYGYEFPLPASVKAREKERMQPIALAATYQAAAPTTVAEAAPPPPPPPAEEAPAPAPTPAPAPQPQAAPAPPPPPMANREMPATSAGWLMMLLAGSTLSGAGIMLRGKR